MFVREARVKRMLRKRNSESMFAINKARRHEEGETMQHHSAKDAFVYECRRSGRERGRVEQVRVMRRSFTFLLMSN